MIVLDTHALVWWVSGASRLSTAGPAGDPADRIIAATALALQAKLVTADERLRRSVQVQCIW